MPHKPLPTELVELCVDTYLSDLFATSSLYCRLESSHPPKPAWTSVQALSLTSRRLRDMAMKQWLAVLRLPLHGGTREVLEQVPDTTLVRALHLRQDGHEWVSFSGDHRNHFTMLPDLQTLRFDGLGAVLIQVFSDETEPVPSVRELDIRWFEEFIPGLVSSTARLFPHLQTLRIGAVCTWCALCNLTDTLDYSSPASFVYRGGTGLPKYLATLFLPLVHLKTIVFTMVLRRDYYRGEDTIEMRPGWSGECADCTRIILNVDHAFAQGWDEAKAEYPHPESLDRVEWHVIRNEVVRLLLGIEDSDEELAEIGGEHDIEEQDEGEEDEGNQSLA